MTTSWRAVILLEHRLYARIILDETVLRKFEDFLRAKNCSTVLELKRGQPVIHDVLNCTAWFNGVAAADGGATSGTKLRFPFYSSILMIKYVTIVAMSFVVVDLTVFRQLSAMHKYAAGFGFKGRSLHTSKDQTMFLPTIARCHEDGTVQVVNVDELRHLGCSNGVVKVASRKSTRGLDDDDDDDNDDDDDSGSEGSDCDAGGFSKRSRSSRCGNCQHMSFGALRRLLRDDGSVNVELLTSISVRHCCDADTSAVVALSGFDNVAASQDLKFRGEIDVHGLDRSSRGGLPMPALQAQYVSMLVCEVVSCCCLKFSVG